MNASQCQMGTIALHGAEWLADAIASLAFYDSLHPYISVLLCVAGTFMNMITVAVLTHPSMISPVNVLLSAVAICDIIVMTSVLVFVTHFQIYANTRCVPTDFSYTWAIFMYGHAQASVIFHATSIWLTVILAQIRVLTIRRATKAPTEATTVKSTAVIAVVTLLVVFSVNFPNMLSTEIKGVPAWAFLSCMQEDENNTLSKEVAAMSEDFVYLALPSGGDDCALFQLALWTNGLFFKVVPCGMLTVSIVALLKIISDVSHRRRSLAQVMNKKKMPRDHTTPMLVAVLSIFLLAEFPQGVLHLCRVIFTDETFYHTIYLPLGNIMDLLSLVNSAVNFIIYCAMSRKFRIVFLQLVSPLLPDCISLKLQQQFAAGDFEASRSHRPSAITDLTRTEQLALTSHRPSTASVLLRAPSSDNLSRAYTGEYLGDGLNGSQHQSLLTVPATGMTPRVSFDDRSKSTKRYDVRSSLEIHELSLTVPSMHRHEDEGPSMMQNVISAISPVRLLRSLRRYVRRPTMPSIAVNVAHDKDEPQETTPLPSDMSPQRRISLLRIEFSSPPGL